MAKSEKINRSQFRLPEILTSQRIMKIVDWNIEVHPIDVKGR